MATGSLSMCCQKFRPNTLGQQGTTISSVTLVCNLQLLYWQGQGQNQDLWLQISTSTKMLFLSPFIFLKTNLRRKHRHNCCSLTIIREKMQLSIFLVPSSVWCNLTNEEDSRQSVPPLHGPQSCLASSCWRELLHTASIKAGELISSSQSLAQTTAEEDTTAVRCRVFQLVAPSLLWTLPFQNPCITTTLGNSKKKGKTSALHIYYTFSVIFGAAILPTPLPFACQPSCVTVKDQSYKMLRLLNVFLFGSLGIYWVKGLFWKPPESRSPH